jgi:hypothetical protein
VTYPDLERLIAAIQYRPGFTMFVRCEDRGITYSLGASDRGGLNCPTITFTLSGWIKDAYSGEERHIDYSVHTDGLYLEMRNWDEERMIAHIWERVILRFETHEAGEFFMVRGHRPYDPHRPGGTL